MRSAAYLDNSCHGEDLIYRKRGIIAVMDGVSESDGAQAANAVAEALERLPPREAIMAAHDTLKGTGALTTAVVADLTARTLYNVGDSPAYHVNGKMIELAVLDRDPSAVNIVTQAIGSGDLTIHEARIPASGFLLLMSDGISDNLSPERIAECCSGTRSPRTVVKRIFRMLERKKRHEKGYEYEEFKEDDCALVVVRL